MPTWEADNPILQRRLGSAGVALIYFRATQISETTYLVDLDKWACSPFWSSLVFSRTQSFSSLLCLYALSTVYYGFTKMGAWKMLKNRIREYRAKYDMKQEDLASVKFFTNSHIEHADWEDVFDWINEKAEKIIGETTIVRVKTFD